MSALSGLNKRRTKKQIFTIAVLVCFVTISLLSGAFIITHNGHEHDHNYIHGTCAVCAQIQTAEGVLRLLAVAVIGGFATVAILYTADVIIGVIWADADALTPITAKIRMNN